VRVIKKVIINEATPNPVYKKRPYVAPNLLGFFVSVSRIEDSQYRFGLVLPMQKYDAKEIAPNPIVKKLPKTIFVVWRA
jgi:hypothetical protein